ncbi:DUF502 domain-containing protein [Candidatus Bipolaricaulota bacterium]|nr:DUF502 domain-containing protein [Candidatus Bipolaricaulota bacterium]
MRRLLLWLRRTFISGLLALLPLGLTVYLLWLMYRLAYSVLGPHTAFAGLMRRLIGRYVPGTEVVITILVVFLVGVIARHWVGRGLLHGVERVVRAIPGVRNVYWGTRQLAQVIFHREQALGRGRRIVLVEFPYPGSYVLGILTNEDVASVSNQFSPDTISVYVPTAPNPLSGWVLFVPRTRITPVNLTAEEAFSLILSGGLIGRYPDSRAAFPESRLTKDCAP